MKPVVIIGLVAALMCGPVAWADEPPAKPPLSQAERDAAIAHASQFQEQLKSALTQPVNPLYLTALSGSANDKWVWGLALTAKRFDTDSVPPAQLKIYNDYARKVDKAKDKYARKHKDEALADRAMEEWVTPTPEEAQAVKIVHAINTPSLWLEAARNGIDGVLIDQSSDCMGRLQEQVAADDMMHQLMASMGMDIGAVLSELSATEKDDEDLDNEAVCGGADAWTANKAMVKAIYKPEFTISVSGGRE